MAFGAILIKSQYFKKNKRSIELLDLYEDMDQHGGLILRKSNGANVPISLEDDEVMI